MEFVRIPAGAFMMGSPDADTEAHNDEKPAHRVTISQPFYLGKYPVTQTQWEAVMGNNPSKFKDHPNHPVEHVSWHDVQAFLRKLNEREGGGDYHLPTEAQWEYACRAATETPGTILMSRPSPGIGRTATVIRSQWSEIAECMGIIRHAGQCMGVVPRWKTDVHSG